MGGEANIPILIFSVFGMMLVFGTMWYIQTNDKIKEMEQNNQNLNDGFDQIIEESGLNSPTRYEQIIAERTDNSETRKTQPNAPKAEEPSPAPDQSRPTDEQVEPTDQSNASEQTHKRQPKDPKNGGSNLTVFLIILAALVAVGIGIAVWFFACRKPQPEGQEPNHGYHGQAQQPYYGQHGYGQDQPYV